MSKCLSSYACRLRFFLNIFVGGFVVIGIAALGVAITYHKSSDDKQKALDNFRFESNIELENTQDRASASLTQLYEAMRTISLMPGVRQIDRHATNLDVNTLLTIQQIFNNMKTNLGVSEIYIVPADLNPSQIDPVTGKPEEPIKMFDQLLIDFSLNPKLEGKPAEANEDESQEYSYFQKDIMPWFQKNYPTRSSFQGLNIPLIGSPPLITCDNAVYDQTHDDNNRKGIIFSVPFYGADNTFKGTISAIVRLDVLAALLPNNNYALVNAGMGVIIPAVPTGQVSASLPYVKKAKPDPSLLFSRVVSAGLFDARSPWKIWFGQPNATFTESAEIKNLQDFTYAAYTVTLLLTLGGLGLVGYIGLLIRQRENNLRIQSQLEKARHEALEAVRAKGDFLAVMSHEIRTPMNGVFGMLDILLRSNITPEQADLLNTAKRSAEGLQVVLNDVLDYSKMESGELQLEDLPFDLQQVVEDIADVFAPLAEKKGFTLIARYVPGTPTHVKGDPVRMRQVLNNFISNAVKFTHEGAVILTVSAEREPADAPTAYFTLSVTDTGIGIPADKIDTIFQRFSQADASTTRKYGGTGLGLAIAKGIVEKMQGFLNVTSTPGKGSTFAFTVPLPLAEVPTRPDHERRESPQNLQGTHVLVVEDHPINRDIFIETLTQMGATCVAVDHAQNAWQTLQENPDAFQLAIIDFQLPDLNGADLARMIRADARFVNLRLLVCTSISTQDLHMFEEAGFSGYLTKPIRGSVLGNMLMAVRYRGKIDGMLTRQKLRKVEQEAPPPVTLPKMHILVAEDDPVNQMVASRFISMIGSTCDVADNGQDALAKIQDGHHYDLVLMDMRMPVMDGIEATWRLREWEKENHATPLTVMAMTANAAAEDLANCEKAGMNGFMSKPLTFEKFYNALATLKMATSTTTEPDATVTVVASGSDTSLTFDHALLTTASGGDGAFEQALLSAFQKEAEIQIDTLKQSKPGEEAWRRAAHRLKGASVNVGLNKLSAACGKAEKDDFALRAPDHLQTLQSLLQEGFDTLREHGYNLD